MADPKEYGYGEVDGRTMYYEKDGDRLDIFPGGMPGAHHSQRDHDHIVTNDGVNASYVREHGETVVDDSPRSSTYTGYSGGRGTSEAAELRESLRNTPAYGEEYRRRRGRRR